MKMLAFCTGLFMAVAANAGAGAKAPLVGQHHAGYFEGSALLVCKYAGSRANFEIVSQNGKCAPYIDVL